MTIRNMITGVAGFAVSLLTIAAGAATPDYFVEYIESDGNQWIDTGIPAMGSIAATVDFQLTEYVIADRTILGGSGAASDNCLIPLRYRNTLLGCRYLTKYIDSSVHAFDERVTVDCELSSGAQTFTIGGSTVSATHSGSWETSQTVTLFALNADRISF